MVIFHRQCLAVIKFVWEASQVEHRGKYAPHRLLALHRYTRGSHRVGLWRVVAAIALTPVPSLLFISLPEMVTLNPPYEGLKQNYAFFGRMFLTFLVFCSLLTQQASDRLPDLPLSFRQCIIIAVCIAVSIVTVNYSLATRIGFPVPFTIQLSTPTHFAIMSMILALIWRYRRGEMPKATTIASASMIFVCQAIAISVYPIYYYAFTRVPSGPASVAFSMLLPVLKIAFRNLFSRFCSKNDDKTPPIVVFNADVANALFVTYCLQYNPSLGTTIGLMVANAAQVVLSIKDVNAILTRLRDISEKIDAMKGFCARTSDNRLLHVGATHLQQADDMMERSIDIFARYSEIDSVECKDAPRQARISIKTRLLDSRPVATTRVIRPLKSLRPIQVIPVIVVSPSAALLISTRTKNAPRISRSRKKSASNLELRMEAHAAQLERLERQYTNQASKILHVTEYSILIEYVEVIIPVLYSLYLVIMYQMPNRVYYSQFVDMDAAKMRAAVANVLLYSLVELVSLVALDGVLRRKLRFSTLWQLAFVLDRQAVHVQSALVIWVFYTTQVSLDHFGADYSFRFDWLDGQ